MWQKISFSVLIIVLCSLCEAQNYRQNGGTVTKSGQTYTSSSADTSAVMVLGGGSFTLSNSTITKTGNSSNVNTSSQYGLNAGVLAKAASKIILTGTHITTDASGANGLFATGTNSSITMTGGSINCSATGSHGIDVTYGGSITLNNVNVTTAGNSASAALSTDFGGGTLNVTGGIIRTTGNKSPGIYSTGSVTVTDAHITATAGNGGVIDGNNSISLVHTYLQGSTNGIKCHSTASGSNTATITISGDTLKSVSGDGFYIEGTGADITVSNGAKIIAGSGYILNMSSGTVVFTANSVPLSGNFHTEINSSLTVNLKNNSTLKGYINKTDSAKTVSVSLDATSTWTLTANSYVSTIANPSISGTSVTNITGNGYNVYYKPSLNTSLGGKNYNLVSGGCLLPTGGNCMTTGIGNRLSSPGDFSCFPSPTNGIVYVNKEFAQNNVFELTVYNSYGKRIIQGKNLSSIDLSPFCDGVFLITVKTDNLEVFSRKIVLIK